LILPVLLSVPHAGRRIPSEVSDVCMLSERDVLEDGDAGAAEIYRGDASLTMLPATRDEAAAVGDVTLLGEQANAVAGGQG